MYKVFVDQRPIYFQKSQMLKSNLPERFLPELKTELFSEFQEYLKNRDITTDLFISNDLPWDELKNYFKHFEWIEAAGGIVQNTQTKKLLFIQRFGKWDLPKGKIENQETPEEAAIREIQEECGLQNMTITNTLSPTFHAYFAYGKHWIKKTHWYQLETEETKVEGQTEEDITAVKWLDYSELVEAKKNTWGNIKELL